MKDGGRARQLAGAIYRAFSLGVLLVGIALGVYACIQWLQTAHWQPLTVEGLLAGSPTTRNWITSPHSWLGLHRVVAPARRVPVFLIVMLLGMVLFVVSPQTDYLSRKRGFR